MDIKGVVMQAVKKFNAKKQYWQVVDEDTVLRGEKSPLPPETNSFTLTT